MERGASGGSEGLRRKRTGGARLAGSGGDTLRMLGVGEALEEAIGGAQLGKSHFGPVDERGEAFAMAFAGFAEEDSFDAAAGAQGFLDKAHAFDADGAGFRG